MRLTSNSPKMCIKEPTEFETDLVFNPMRKLGDSFRIKSNIKAMHRFEEGKSEHFTPELNQR